MTDQICGIFQCQWKKPYLVTAGLVLFLILYACVHHFMYSPRVENPVGLGEKSFLELALESKTSKVTDSRYQCVYEEALAPYRRTAKLKILEIGLGCDMPYGPGASFNLWTSYFLDPYITMFEYNERCGRSWLASLSLNQTKDKKGGKLRLPGMFYGDMSDRIALRKMALEMGPWDIIIDDGHHHPRYQIPAFETLFEFVRPGGTYFIEDLIVWSFPPSEKTVTMIAHLYQMSIAETYNHILKPPEANRTNWKAMGLKFDRLTCCDLICAIRAKPK